MMNLFEKYLIIFPMPTIKSWSKNLLGAALMGSFLLGPSPLLSQDQPSLENGASMVGESCLSVSQQRREICKKSSTTCTDVHALEALNLIKACAQLAQECDQLGEQEDMICQPGGNGNMTRRP